MEGLKGDSSISPVCPLWLPGDYEGQKQGEGRGGRASRWPGRGWGEGGVRTGGDPRGVRREGGVREKGGVLGGSLLSALGGLFSETEKQIWAFWRPVLFDSRGVRLLSLRPGSPPPRP